MTQAQEQAVRELQASFGGEIDRLFFMEGIPQKRLDNAKRSYAGGFEADEVPIFLWDDTVFGSAKDGFLLTDRRLYQKNFTEGASSSELSGIVDFDISAKMAGLTLTPTGNSTLNPIKMQNGGGVREVVATRLIHMIYALTGRVIGGEQEETPEAFSGEPTLLTCPGCGTAVAPSAMSCEYCDRRFR